MKKEFIKAIGMIHNEELADILTSEYNLKMCEIVDLRQIREFPEKFFWRNNPSVMKALNKVTGKGAFNFIVLIFQ